MKNLAYYYWLTPIVLYALFFFINVLKKEKQSLDLFIFCLYTACLIINATAYGETHRIMQTIIVALFSVAIIIKYQVAVTRNKNNNL